MTLSNNVERPSLIIHALEFALLKHKDQFRADGLPYIVHPLRMVELLRSVGINDENILCATLLHDILEDTPTLVEEISGKFNQQITNLVLELTKRFYGEKKKVDLDEIVKNMSPNAKIIKLADRIDNLYDIKRTWSLEKIKEYVLESIELYYRLKDVHPQLSKHLWTLITQIQKKYNF